MAIIYDYENRTAFNPETGEGTPNAVGQVFAKTDTTFATPLVVTLMGSGLSVTDLTTDQYCQLQGFQAVDLVQVVFKSGDFTKILNTTTPLVGPAGPAIAGAVDNGDNTVTFTLPDGSPAATVALPASDVPGPPGDKGEPGDQGLPGVNAVPADEAVGTYATTPGTATHTALTATYGRKSAASVDAYTVAANMPDGPTLEMSETGTPARTFGNGSSFFVENGVITNVYSGTPNGAAYLQTKASGTVHRIFAVLNAPATSGSNLAFVLPSSEWRVGGNGPLTPAGVHYVVQPSTGTWHVGYWTGSAEETFASGTLARWDDGTDRYAEITVDTVASSITITHPDGSVTTHADSRIAPNISEWGIIEAYSNAGSSLPFTISQFGIAEKAPSAAEPFLDRPGVKKVVGIDLAERGMTGTSAMLNTNTTGSQSITIPSARTPILRKTIKRPETGKVLVTMEAFILATATGIVLFHTGADVKGGSGSGTGGGSEQAFEYGSNNTAGTVRQRITASRVVTVPGVTGQEFDIVFSVQQSGGVEGNTKYVIDETSGKRARLNIIPVAADAV